MSTKNSTNQKKLSRVTKMGWAFPDGTINAVTDIQANNWHTISAMWYELESDGDFLKRDSSTFGANFYYTAANALIVRENCAVALVNVSSGSATAVNALTTSSAKRALLIAEMISFCQTNNFDGVDLDLETFQTASMSAAQWVDFKTLLQELGDALHAEGLMLSIEVPPVWNTAANTESGSGDAWDSADSENYYRLRYAEINNLPVDQVVIMAYDYQYDYSAGEPNQPLKWFKEILNYARGEFNEDRIKLVAGIPAAGYSGTTAGYSITGRTYAYLSAQTGFSGASRDANSGEVIWANAGTSYALCDDNSIAQKIAQAEAVGVFAVALWHIGDNRYYNAYSGNSYPENRKFNTPKWSSKSFVIETPTTADDMPMFRTDVAITLKKVSYLCIGGTNWVGQVQECDANGGSGADVHSGDVTATAGTVNSSVSFSNDSIDAGDWVGIKTTSVSGTPTRIHVTVYYLEN